MSSISNEENTPRAKPIRHTFVKAPYEHTAYLSELDVLLLRDVGDRLLQEIAVCGYCLEIDVGAEKGA